MPFFQPKHGTVPEIQGCSYGTAGCGRTEIWEGVLPRKAHYLIVHFLRFKGRWAISLTWPEHDAGREGLRVTAALGSLCLWKDWGGGSVTSGALQLLLSERPPLGTTSGFILDSVRLLSPFPALLPWAPGSQPQSSTLQLAVRLGKLRTPVLQDSNSADLYDNKSNC